MRRMVSSTSRRMRSASRDTPTGPDVAACLAIAQQAEALGFDFLYASENLLNCIHGPRESVADAWTILAAIAAVTHKVGLCGAVKPGFRSPFLVARMLDTLTRISERRRSISPVSTGSTMTAATTGRRSFCARCTGCSTGPPRPTPPAERRRRALASRPIMGSIPPPCRKCGSPAIRTAPSAWRRSGALPVSQRHGR
ncbi:LLM class flavin-dependent oxidoreductase [Ancylobacter vacuolatus]|uniref:LLM class flavin-dependent oxidoreductase n=1 Tax=Ancylobacter vacuolatus TaxID=223389 RepID=UPI0027D850E9|nr:LLM class flavin-dependent oxidoreductase [Ancylobacter vacuolatus]